MREAMQEQKVYVHSHNMSLPQWSHVEEAMQVVYFEMLESRQFDAENYA